MDSGSPIVPLTIAFFLAGMTLLGFVVIVVETWWVVAVVGIVHIVGSLILGILVVLDNREHASAGRVPTQAAVLDLVAVVRGFGLPVDESDEPDGLRAALARAAEGGRLAVVYARIEGGNEAGIPFLLEDPAAIAARFREALHGG